MLKTTLHKKPTVRVPEKLCSKKIIYKKIKTAESKEYSETYFNGNLINSNYDKLELGDFNTLLEYLKQENSYKRIESSIHRMHTIFSEILSAKHFLPILLKGKNNNYYLVSGNEYMMAYKVLGISPIVKVIDIPKEI